MSFENITTPSDLLEANNTPKSPLEVAKEAMCDDSIGWDESRELMGWLLANAIEWHKSIAAGMKANGEENDLGWAMDAGKLMAMIEILKTVD